MKLLYIHNSYYNPMKANFVGVLSMCNAFSALGVDCTLAILDSGISEDQINKLIISQYGFTSAIKISLIPSYMCNGRLAKYVSYLSGRKVIKDVKPDVCYVREPISFKLCMSLKVNTIFESHNARLHYRIPAIDKFFKKTLLKSSRKNEFLKLITISEALREFWVREGVNDEKTLSLHVGFNEKLFHRPLSQEKARNKLELPNSKKIVVYTGSLYADRQIENLLDLAEQFNEVGFMIIGGPDEQKLYYQKVALAKGLTNVDFVGRIEHKRIPEYLYAADVLLAIWSRKVPTINYCSPLKVFEYMAAGRIIVAHGFPTIREVLTDGKTALLADPDSKEDLSRKMKIALNMEYPCEIAENARSLAFANYTWRVRAKRILDSIGNLPN